VAYYYKKPKRIVAGSELNVAAFVRNSYVSVWPKPLDLPPMQVPPLVPAGDAFHLRQEKARPGVLKDGSPATGKYTVGIRKGDAEKLKVVARQHHLELSRLLVGVGLNLFSLPLFKGGYTEPDKDKWTTVTVFIRDTEWDRMKQNAAKATWGDGWSYFKDRLPDPAAFCVQIALGMARHQNPAPVLLTDFSQSLMMDLHRAVRLAHFWNPWLLPLPPMKPLIAAVARMQRWLELYGHTSIRDCDNMAIFHVVSEIEERMNRCESTKDHWLFLIAKINYMTL